MKFIFRAPNKRRLRAELGVVKWASAKPTAGLRCLVVSPTRYLRYRVELPETDWSRLRQNIMVTSLLPNPTSSATTRQSGPPLASEFRLLGLRPREARLDVIRGAVRETASDVKEAEGPGASDDGQVARVAVAGYRLLDPRRRGTLFERVQLLLWTDDEAEAPGAALWDVPLEGDKRDQQAQAQLNGPAAFQAPPQGQGFQPSRDAEETQAALEVFRSMRKRDRRATALWISIAALALSLASTVALVAAYVYW